MLLSLNQMQNWKSHSTRSWEITHIQIHNANCKKCAFYWCAFVCWHNQNEIVVTDSNEFRTRAIGAWMYYKRYYTIYLIMYISNYFNNNSIAVNWMISYPFIMKSNGKVTGNTLMVWPGFFITVTEVKTHSASQSCVALLAPSKCFSADAELIKEETVLHISKLVLVKKNGWL